MESGFLLGGEWVITCTHFQNHSVVKKDNESRFKLLDALANGTSATCYIVVDSFVGERHEGNQSYHYLGKNL